MCLIFIDTHRPAEILLQQARSYSPDDRPVLTRLCANRAAKERIVGLILDQARGPSDAVIILQHGLVNQEDIPWLLSRLDVCPSRDSTVVAFLVASLLDPTDVPTFDRVLLKRETSAALARELEPRLAAVIFNSPEEQEARRIDALRREASRAPALPPPVPLGKLIAAMDDSDPHAFMGVCSGICKHCRSVPDLKEEPLPGWNDLNSPLREQLVLAAVRSVREDVPPAPQWLGRGSTPYISIFGYWALRLLYLQAPETFKSLSGDVWHLWTSSVVGFPFFGDAESYSAILRTAYERAPAQFLEAFQCLIDGENDCPLPTLLSSRLLILWNECIADTLRSNLTSDKLRPPCFESVVAALLEHGDLPTRELAASLARDDLAPEGVDHQRACIVARHLLFHHPEIAWEIVWPALQANKELAQELLSPLAYAGRELMARNPDLGWNTVWPALQSCSELAVEFFSGLMGYDADFYGSTHLLLKRLSEPQLAEFYISIARHAPTPRGQDAGFAITPERDLGLAKQIVIGELEGRGTVRVNKNETHGVKV